MLRKMDTLWLAMQGGEEIGTLWDRKGAFLLLKTDLDVASPNGGSHKFMTLTLVDIKFSNNDWRILTARQMRERVHDCLMDFEQSRIDDSRKRKREKAEQ